MRHNPLMHGAMFCPLLLVLYLRSFIPSGYAGVRQVSGLAVERVKSTRERAAGAKIANCHTPIHGIPPSPRLSPPRGWRIPGPFGLPLALQDTPPEILR